MFRLPRLNIEDGFWLHPRTAKLQTLFAKDPATAHVAAYVAVGAIVTLWKTAQQYVTEEGAVIPEEIFNLIEASSKLIEANCVTRKQNGYFVEGSKEHLSWLASKRKNASKGGLVKSDKKLKNLKNNRSTLEAQSKQTEASSNPHPTSSSYILHPHALPHSEVTKKEKKTKLDTPSGDQPDKASGSIAEYFDLWQKRYEGKAPLTGKDFSLIKSIVKSNGDERTRELLRAYFTMPDAYFLKRRHDVVTFNANLSQVAHYANTGTTISQSQARAADQMAGNFALMNQFKTGDKK